MTKDPKSRQSKIEDFTLNPERSLFLQNEELVAALTWLQENFSDIDIDALENTIGEDGKTPIFGEDYFTDEQLDGFEQFIRERLPQVDVDYPSTVTLMSHLNDLVSKIKVPEGKPGYTPVKGKDYFDGKPGKNGSADTGEQITAKIKEVKGAARLGMANVKGLTRVVQIVKEHDDSIEELNIKVGQKFVALGADITAAGVSDHGALAGLGDDDHLQYHNDARGDIRYHTKTVQDATDLVQDNAIALNTAKNTYPAADAAKVGFISVTQAVDLDTIESDTAANNAKISYTDAAAVALNTAKDTNATHTGEVTGDGVLTIDKTAVSGKGLVTAALGDHIVVGDVSDTDNLKKVTVQTIIDLAAGTDLTVGSITSVALDVQSSTGANATLPAANLTDAGLMVAADKTKLVTIEPNADVTDTANVTAAGALMDSEVDADIKTLVLPASTTISAFGATLIDDATAAAARTTLGAGTMDNPMTTQGDTLYGGVSGVPTRLAKGTAAQVLTMNAGATAPEWAAAGGGGGGASNFASAYKTSSQSITTGSPTKITFQAEDYDTDGDFDLANDKYTAPSAGKYLVTGQLRQTNVGTADYAGILIRVNGSTKRTIELDSGHTSRTGKFSEVLDLASSDYVEIFMESGDTSYSINHTAITGNAATDKTTRVDICKLG